MEAIQVIVDEMENDIFQLDFKAVGYGMVNLIEELAQIDELLSYDQKQMFNEILGYLNIAYENKDYLLLADLLRYELLRFLNSYSREIN